MLHTPGHGPLRISPPSPLPPPPPPLGCLISSVCVGTCLQPSHISLLPGQCTPPNVLLPNCALHNYASNSIQGLVSSSARPWLAAQGLVSSAGFCVAYLVFIAQNLEPMTGYRGVYFILVACPIVAAIAMLTGVRALAPFSIVADAANVLGTLLLLLLPPPPPSFSPFPIKLLVHATWCEISQRACTANNACSISQHSPLLSFSQAPDSLLCKHITNLGAGLVDCLGTSSSKQL